jgi:hypothetical protein
LKVEEAPEAASIIAMASFMGDGVRGYVSISEGVATIMVANRCRPAEPPEIVLMPVRDLARLRDMLTRVLGVVETEDGT